MKQHKGKIIGAALILCLLAAAYFLGGTYAGGGMSYRAEAPSSGTMMPDSSPKPEFLEAAGTENFPESPPDSATANNTPQPDTPDTTVKPAKAEKTPLSPSTPSPAIQGKGSSEGVLKGSASYSEEQGMILDAETGKDKYLTEPVPEGKPLQVEPQEAEIKDQAHTCTLSVRCDTLLDNMELLDKEKWELVPEDGVVFPATEVTFYEGELVFNLLQREMKKNKIHMEFRNTPMYNSAYIRAINNLYEFDAGELSGWMYKVNDWFPNYGSSRYQLKPGDVVEWVYSCDLGRDVGGDYASGYYAKLRGK